MQTSIPKGATALLCLCLATKAAAEAAWKPCALEGVQGKSECTTISIAEDRAKPKGRRIARQPFLCRNDRVHRPADRVFSREPRKPARCQLRRQDHASALCAAGLITSLGLSLTRALTITSAASIHRTRCVRSSEDGTQRIGVIRG